jgi:hypothetical protein
VVQLRFHISRADIVDDRQGWCELTWRVLVNPGSVISDEQLGSCLFVFDCCSLLLALKCCCFFPDLWFWWCDLKKSSHLCNHSFKSDELVVVQLGRKQKLSKQIARKRTRRLKIQVINGLPWMLACSPYVNPADLDTFICLNVGYLTRPCIASSSTFSLVHPDVCTEPESQGG